MKSVQLQCLLTFSFTSYELLLGKLKAYRFYINSLNFILAYFNSCKQKTKIGSSFTDCLKNFFGVPQGLILKPFPFSICISDLLLECDKIEFAIYTEDTTPYSYAQSLHEIMEKLEIDLLKICEQFHQNGFETNPGNFHFLPSPFVGRPIIQWDLL